MLKIIVNGCHGKMGQVLIREIKQDNTLQLLAGIDTNPKKLTVDFPVYKSISECREKADVIIDFSSPEALEGLLEYAVKTNTPLVIATTGLSQDQMYKIMEASKLIPIFQSANMSIGINVLVKAVQQTAKLLGDSADIEIIEKHHNQKVDAPSGTAYLIADRINSVLSKSKDYIFGRHSKTAKRNKNHIGIHAIRGGTIVGEHSVIFACKDEVIEITHSAASKSIFSLGAIKAAKFVASKEPSFYTMDDLVKKS